MIAKLIRKPTSVTGMKEKFTSLSLWFVVGMAFCLFLKMEVNAANSDRIVVMVSIDGLAAYYLDDPKADMPNIRALAKAGARASSMKSVMPTVTWPNHTTLVTGVTPAHHGVVGNNYYNRAKKEQLTLIFDPVYDKDEIVKVPTIYDAAKSSGLLTAAVNWPASRNAKTLDWTTPEVHKPDLYRKYTTPSVLRECDENGIALLEEVFPAGKEIAGKTDEIYTRVFNLLIHKHRPQLALLHLSDVDHTEHESGPKSVEAYATIQKADERVGEIWKMLQRDFPDKATLIVVSDHGFSPIKSIVLPNIVLRQAGLVEVKEKKITGGAVRVVSQGGAAMLYVLDEANRSAVIGKIEKAFRKVKGISKIVKPEQLSDYGMANPKVDPNAPDMMLLAEMGYTFGDTAAGDVPFNEKPERLGSHGHDASFPELHATFVAWGAGIKAGSHLGEINNLDVAPTIAKLLKISLPSTDGKPLQEILAP
jgi:predicted AlkP superfamily pyrophosphatase or phosphodiesterase